MFLDPVSREQILDHMLKSLERSPEVLKQPFGSDWGPLDIQVTDPLVKRVRLLARKL